MGNCKSTFTRNTVWLRQKQKSNRLFIYSEHSNRGNILWEKHSITWTLEKLLTHAVDHRCLLRKMVQLWISQQILTILQSMYSKAMSRVKLSNGDVTDQFSCEIEVRQGCNLSPLVFSLFISRLESELVKTNGNNIGEQTHWSTDVCWWHRADVIKWGGVEKTSEISGGFLWSVEISGKYGKNQICTWCPA